MGKGVIGSCLGTGACFDSTTCFSALFGERNWITRLGCSAGKLDDARFGTSGRVEVFRYDREK